jgi:hypothetical protein
MDSCFIFVTMCTSMGWVSEAFGGVLSYFILEIIPKKKNCSSTEISFQQRG